MEFRRVNDLGVWPKVEGLIAEACNRSDGEISDKTVHLDLIQCRKQLWIGASEQKGIEVVVLTEVRQHALKRVLVIVLCTGDGRYRWIDKFTALKDYAREQGCERVRALSRPGWRRDLTKMGFRHTHDIMEFDLDG